MATLKTISRFLILGWLFPGILSCVAYFGFASNYSLRKFSLVSFRVLYDNGIYRYRILGRSLVEHFSAFLQSHHVPVRVPNLFFAMDPDGLPSLFAAHFLVNTLFICLTCSVLFFILTRFFGKVQSWLTDLLVLLFALLFAITQYVITPYDALSYFLFGTSIFLILFADTLPGFLLLCGTIILASLNRETAALTLSFYFAVHSEEIFVRKLFSRRQLKLLVLTLMFLLTYLLLRIVLGAEQAAYQEVLVTHIFHSPLSLLGLLFLVGILFIFLTDNRNRRDCLLFTLATLPYILPMLFVAYLWELRLWVPVIMGLVLFKVRPENSQKQKSGNMIFRKHLFVE